MELKDNLPTFHARSAKEWRKWLEKNHRSEKSVWLIIYKKESKVPSIYYPEAVDEALCFGWIDSKPNKRDEQSYYQFFAKRNPKSNWSKINKLKVEKLLAQNLMAPAGLESIKTAQQNGSWSALDEVENISIPGDLGQAFDNNPKAFENWERFPRSSKRGILEWILNAKKEDTRKKRIEETVQLATKNIKANHYNQ
ncbi:MAG: YdeI/OmpD-associated family protein [Ferruginibacter sp.]|nr:YdeI/OmpD-associated family protein [Ferruginibacter sp.]